jgi:hypothetical protein
MTAAAASPIRVQSARLIIGKKYPDWHPLQSAVTPFRSNQKAHHTDTLLQISSFKD